MKSDETVICSNCNGSGEGMHDGSTCYVCHGSGEVRTSDDDYFEEAEED